jgi:aminopeptidase YwaD
MKNYQPTFAFVFLTLSLTLSVPAQKAEAIEKNLREHVQYLASDKLEGRRTGEQGATYAAGYIANAFANYKLRAGSRGTNGKPNYLQPFPFVAAVSPDKGNILQLKTSSSEGEISAEVLWSPLAYSTDADIPASPVVFAGYGISMPGSTYDDYAGLDVKNKIVLILDGNPDAGNPHSEFARFNTHIKANIKANIAKEKGARALLVIATEPDFKNDRLSSVSYDQTFGTMALPVAVVDRATGARLLGLSDANTLFALEKQVATRPAGTAIKLQNPVNATARLKIAMIKRQSDAYNVIGILDGHDPVLKNEAIIIGAHYDHLGRGGQGSLDVNSTAIHHGADDNASGTSAVLELARQFAVAKENKRTLIFIAFSGEEEGLLGSNFYVNNPVWPLEKTVAMINLDMVGRLKDGKLNVGGVGTATELRALVTNTANGFESKTEKIEMTMGQPTKTGIVSSSSFFNLQLNEDGFGPSDHSSFYGKKIPVLFFFTGTHADYHKPSDTFEKINYQGLSLILYMVSRIAGQLSQAPTRPTYTVAKSTGMPGRTGFNVSLGTVPNYADSSDGLLLDAVRDNSPAAKAGVKAGDKVVKLAGRDVRNVMDYTYILGELKAGEEYEIVVLRGSEKLALKIVPVAAARR